MDDLHYVTRDGLRGDLERLGLRPGDTVMLHASVKAIGWVVGGPDMVLQAVLDVLGESGTLLMYVGWDESPYHLRRWSPQRQQAYLEGCPPYDPERSRAYRGWSVLTEYLRTWPGARRSAHPDGSFAAVGSQAAWLVADHPLQYGYGPGSPLDKLCQLGGRVLLLGSPLDSLTLLHFSEHLADVPGKRVVRYLAPLPQGWLEIEEFDTNPDDPSLFEQIARDFLGGQGLTGRVGAAPAFLLEAAPLAEFGRTWLERRYKETIPRDSTR